MKCNNIQGITQWRVAWTSVWRWSLFFVVGLETCEACKVSFQGGQEVGQPFPLPPNSHREQGFWQVRKRIYESFTKENHAFESLGSLGSVTLLHLNYGDLLTSHSFAV